VIPDFINNLKNLRYLNANDNPIYKIPENISNLNTEIQINLSKIVNNNDEECWKEAKEINKKENYEEYIKKFPNGNHVSDAKKELEKFLSIKLETKSKAVIDSVCKKLFKKSCPSSIKK
jgi:glycogen synthase